MRCVKRSPLAGAAVLLACACVGLWLGPSAASAQPGASSRKATTVEALATYPMFFHLQPVRVRGELRVREREFLLAANAREVRVAGQAAASAAGSDARVEVSGVFVDAGRLEAGDPRLRGVDVAEISQRLTGKPWPSVGEVLLLLADRVDAAAGPSSASLRAMAVEPERFEDQPVKVVGRFRGRNLFGDQPNAPGKSRWDFVLQSGDASVWVTGLRPKTDAFSLDIDSRLDSGRWLEVTGTLRSARGLVFVEAASMRLATPPSDQPPSEPVARVSVAGPPPEVVFSVPTQDEADVPPGGTIRLQFSRDVDKETLKGRVRLSYVAVQAPQPATAPALPAIEFTTLYIEASRVLEIRVRQPLEPFRTVQVELLEGITGTDGVAAKPWTLRFTTGG